MTLTGLNIGVVGFANGTAQTTTINDTTYFTGIQPADEGATAAWGSTSSGTATVLQFQPITEYTQDVSGTLTVSGMSAAGATAIITVVSGGNHGKKATSEGDGGLGGGGGTVAKVIWQIPADTSTFSIKVGGSASPTIVANDLAGLIVTAIPNADAPLSEGRTFTDILGLSYLAAGSGGSYDPTNGTVNGGFSLCPGGKGFVDSSGNIYGGGGGGGIDSSGGTVPRNPNNHGGGGGGGPKGQTAGDGTIAAGGTGGGLPGSAGLGGTEANNGGDASGNGGGGGGGPNGGNGGRGANGGGGGGGGGAIGSGGDGGFGGGGGGGNIGGNGGIGAGGGAGKIKGGNGGIIGGGGGGVDLDGIVGSGGTGFILIEIITNTYPCFKEDSLILTNTGYKLVQDLRKGDLVKTLQNGFLPIDMIGKRDIVHLASPNRIKDQLYKCSQPEYPEIFEPLILTGCHSILVDKFASEAQKKKAIEVNENRVFVTDKKYRLPACADERATVYEIPGTYTIYHLALENTDYYMNYGIYANGLLVESCSKRYLKELSNMELIQ